MPRCFCKAMLSIARDPHQVPSYRTLFSPCQTRLLLPSTRSCVERISPRSPPSILLVLFWSLGHLVSHPSFQKLCLYHISFNPHASDLFAFLRRCAGSLRFLTLDSLNFDGSFPEDLDNWTTVELNKLEEIKIIGRNLVRFATSTLRMRNLRTFHRSVYAKQPYLSILYPFIPDTTRNLTLELSSELESASWIQTARFCGYINLRHLRIILPSCPKSRNDNTLHNLGGLVCNFPINHLLQLETITIEVTVPGFAIILPSAWDTPIWREIDAALASLPDAGALTSIFIIFRLLGFDGPENTEDLTQADYAELRIDLTILEVMHLVRAHFRNLEARGVLSMQFGRHAYDEHP